MEQITYTNAVLENFSRSPKKGGTARFSAPLTKPVMKALGVDDIPDFATSLDLGEIEHSATSMILRSKESDLGKGYEYSIDCSKVSGFAVTRLETNGKRGKGSRLELSFHIGFADEEGCSFLEQYMLSSPSCNLTVQYNKTAVQVTIPDDVYATEEQRQGAPKGVQ